MNRHNEQALTGVANDEGAFTAESRHWKTSENRGQN
jgi:hypothetical protein